MPDNHYNTYLSVKKIEQVEIWKLYNKHSKIDLLEEEAHIEEAFELEWAEMRVNPVLHILTLMSNSKRQEKDSWTN